MSGAPSRHLFGTDGIRGRAGDYPLDRDTVERIGAAVVAVLENGGRPARIVIGRDTRESGESLEAALHCGIRRAGGVAVRAGVLPTPGVAHLTAAGDADAGIMISASHNPYHDNGIKVISGDGFKLEDGLEAAIEARLATVPAAGVPGPEPPSEQMETELQERYLTYLIGCASDRRRHHGLRLALDCAHGAAFRVAPRLFGTLGMEVHAIGDRPNGRNINAGCGSVHPEGVAALAREIDAGLGLALDGDADRAILVDRHGRLVDGDHVLYLVARSWKRRGLLRGDTVVGTVMANQWLERELGRDGIALHRTAVGDRYVLQAMRERGCNLGGEPSGHLIFLDHSTTGDGLLTTLMVLDALEELDGALEDWIPTVKKFPQKLINIQVTHKPPLQDHPEIAAAIRAEDGRLGHAGRILVRYSGTEPLVRLMVEAERTELVDGVVDRLGGLLRTHLSSPPGDHAGPGDDS